MGESEARRRTLNGRRSVRWLQLAGAVAGAALLGLGLYIHVTPMAWTGVAVLAISGWCVSAYKL